MLLLLLFSGPVRFLPSQRMRDLKVRLSHLLTDVHCLFIRSEKNMLFRHACNQLEPSRRNFFFRVFLCFFFFVLLFLSKWPP